MIVFLAVNYGPLIFDITNWWLQHPFFFSVNPSRLIRGRWGEKNRESLVWTKFSIKEFSAEKSWKDGLYVDQNFDVLPRYYDQKLTYLSKNAEIANQKMKIKKWL